jgi:hypothetical protein
MEMETKDTELYFSICLSMPTLAFMIMRRSRAAILSPTSDFNKTSRKASPGVKYNGRDTIYVGLVLRLKFRPTS